MPHSWIANYVQRAEWQDWVIFGERTDHINHQPTTMTQLARSSYLASPKSQILRTQFELTRRFPGLMSLWMIFAE